MSFAILLPGQGNKYSLKIITACLTYYGDSSETTANMDKT